MAKKMTYDELSRKLFTLEEELRDKDAQLRDMDLRIITEMRAARADLYDEVFSSIRQLLDQGGEIILRSKIAELRGEGCQE